MNNYLEKPTWLFKPIDDVTNLEKIQREFLKIFTAFYSDIFDLGHDVIQVDNGKVKKLAPNYCKFLKELGIYDIFDFIAFSGSKGIQKENCPIHIDYLNWKESTFSLNLPIIGCENSYTIFYEVNELDGIEKTSRLTRRYGGSIEYPESSSKEIGRVSVNRPAWINPCIPHKPYTPHTDLRLIVLGRFTSEILKYFP